MDNNNYIDIAPSLQGAFIYRIIPKYRLFELFEKKQNALVSPKKWDDPFENFILESRVRLNSGQEAIVGARDQVYGQCWTLHGASDAIWRIYSKNEDGIRVRTKVSVLAESLAKVRGNLSYVEVFIGKVKYLPNKRLMRYAMEAFQVETVPFSKKFVRTLLVKRPAFKHEREVRLLFFDSDGSMSKDVFYYDIDPHALIDQIMIDPRTKLRNAKSLCEEIRDRTQFKGAIKRSLLYAPPPNLIIPYE